MKKKMEKFNYLFFIVLPFIDIITALTTRFINIPISLGIILKGLYSIFIVIYILLYCKNKEKKSFIYYLIFMLVYVLLFILTKNHIWNFNSILTECIALYKYLFTGFILMAFITTSKNEKSNEQISKILFYTLLCYTILLIIPVITGTSFNSYGDRPKEGTIGWFFAGNEISSIMLILFPIYFRNISENIKRKKYLNILLIIPIVYSIYIIGTKTSWFGLLLISIFITIIYIIKERKNKGKLIFSILLVITLILLSFISPTTRNLESNIINTNKKVEVKQETKTTKKEKTKITNKIESCGKTYKIKEFVKDKETRRIINSILSGRENKAYTALKIYKETNIQTKIFGTGFKNNKEINNCNIEKYIEIDILDGLVHFGIYGLFLLIYPFIYALIIMKKKNIFKYSTNIINIFTILLILGLSCLSGHILGYPTPSIYLSMLIVLTIMDTNSKRVVKKA